MIGAQIRRVRKLAPRAAALVLAHDYDSRAKPVCDWGDPDERAWLIDELVSDRPKRCSTRSRARSSATSRPRRRRFWRWWPAKTSRRDPKVPGRWRIARRVAKGRVISTVDPEARHARKSRSQRRDGYKAHICAEPDSRAHHREQSSPQRTHQTPESAPASSNRTPQPPTTPTPTPTPPTPPTPTPPTPTPPTPTPPTPTPPTPTPPTPTPPTPITADTDTADTDSADTDSADTAAVGGVGAPGVRGAGAGRLGLRVGRGARRVRGRRLQTPPSSPSTPSRASPGALHPRRLHHAHTDAQTVTCPSRAHQSRHLRSGPLRRALQHLPPTRPLHHLRRRAQRHRRPTPPPPTSQQDPLGPAAATQAAYQQHSPHGRTLHRMAHPQQGPTRPLPRRRRQPPLAHHQSRSRQPRAPHQPRRHPQQPSPSEAPPNAPRPTPTGPPVSTSQPAAPTPLPIASCRTTCSAVS